MKFPGKAKIEMLRRRYPAGTRIVLEEMDDDQAPPAGTIGEVLMVDDVGDLIMKWENGCGLNLIPGVDKFRKVGDAK